ncbi:unnamed protein product [Caenorhabditis angaria]|uniref:DBF4-type domain-containing protein n=1 Tax=Caenorhabditis angaria TaxID=860376 RepID=A0A9P1IGP1_9PELO|nr:unnamed protein product [Caenorhabditis angaria]
MASDSRRQSHVASSSSRNSNNFASTSSAANFSLNGRGFLLEIDNRQNRNTVSSAIRKHGGEIVVTYHEEKLPWVVVSDHAWALKIEQKKVDIENPSEKMLKALPSLLREAVQRKIKIRTVETFMKQITRWAKGKTKTASATNSTGTMKAISRLPITQNTTTKVVNNTPELHQQKEYLKRRSCNISTTTNANNRKSSSSSKSFVRIDVPRKRPDVRIIDKCLFSQFYTGNDAGFSVFRQADPSLTERRTRDFDQFLRGDFQPAKKLNYKLEDEETYCQFCGKTVQQMYEHEKTDAHRSRVKHQGILTELDRVVMTTKMALSRRKQKSIEMLPDDVISENMDPNSKIDIEKYEYGENKYRICWNKLMEQKRAKITIDDNCNEKEKVENVTNHPPIATFFNQSNEAAFLSFIGAI